MGVMITYTKSVIFCPEHGQMGIQNTVSEETDERDGSRFVTRYWKCPTCGETDKTVDLVPPEPKVRRKGKPAVRTPHKRH